MFTLSFTPDMRKLREIINRVLHNVVDLEEEPEKERLHITNSEEDSESKFTPLYTRLRNVSRKTLLLVLVLASVMVFIALSLSTVFNNKHEHLGYLPNRSRPSHLRIIVPTSDTSDNLCKSLVSAAALEYPVPILVNWQRKLNTSEIGPDDVQVAKLAGVLDYLNTLQDDLDEDIVLIVDEDNVWFQLRASVLIQRYSAITSRAHKQLSQQLGHGKEIHGIGQRILFSVRKECEPQACEAEPEMTFPVDVHDVEDSADLSNGKLLSLRRTEAQLSSGMILGPVQDIRRIFKEALAKAITNEDGRTTDAIFNEMFQEQEKHRTLVAQEYGDHSETILERLMKMLGMKTSLVKLESVVDFGIGLDYDGEIILATTFSNDNNAWVNVSAAGNATASDSLSSNLSHDISASKPPFETFRRRRFPSGTLPRSLSWNQLPLFTNTLTNIVPVLIHHPSPSTLSDAEREILAQNWQNTWYHAHLRPLLDAHVIEPRGPVASIPQPHDQTRIGERKEWWSAENEKGGATVVGVEGGVGVDQREWRFYDTFCRASWGVVFGDGRGDWVDPRFGFD